MKIQAFQKPISKAGMIDVFPSHLSRNVVIVLCAEVSISSNLTRSVARERQRLTPMYQSELPVVNATAPQRDDSTKRVKLQWLVSSVVRLAQGRRSQCQGRSCVFGVKL
jgi:hypothetical protein